MTRNILFSDNKLELAEVQARLQSLLPSSWRLYPSQGRALGGSDAAIDLESPDGRRATLAIEFKSRLDPMDIVGLRRKVAMWSPLPSGRTETVLVVAPYLGERTRERLRESNWSYLDLTGNTRLRLDEPAVFLSSQGATKDPGRSKRPTRTLRGVKAARIVRTLVDRRPPLRVRQIAEIADTDPGNVSRVLEMLEREDLIRRNSQGGLQQVNWEALLRAWTREYSLMGYNAYSTYLDPRGLGNFVSHLPELGREMKYAVTGSLAAARRAPVAPPRLAAVFVEDAAAAAALLGLVPAESGANVILVEPKDDFVYEGSSLDGGVSYVAPSQAVADLLTGTGRNPAEAEELIEWMQRRESEWRVE